MLLSRLSLRTAISRRLFSHLRPRHVSYDLTSTTNLPSTCPCFPTPSGLAIDRVKPLNRTVPPYTRHILLYTGKADWSSKIDDDSSAQPLLGDLRRKVLELPGKTLITASSFSLEEDEDDGRRRQQWGVRVFPDGNEVFLPRGSGGLDAFLRSLRENDGNGFSSDSVAKERDSGPSDTLTVSHLTRPTILICSHNCRDSRCGTLGPLLHAEFHRQSNLLSEKASLLAQPDVAMISHIGGHAFAGNVLIYFPPRWSFNGQDASQSARETISSKHPLAGCGLWYGRVEPKHVEGILQETVGRGAIISDLLRGGITANGEPLDFAKEMGADITGWKAKATSRE